MSAPVADGIAVLDAIEKFAVEAAKRTYVRTIGPALFVALSGVGIIIWTLATESISVLESPKFITALLLGGVLMLGAPGIVMLGARRAGDGAARHGASALEAQVEASRRAAAERQRTGIVGGD